MNVIGVCPCGYCVSLRFKKTCEDSKISAAIIEKILDKKKQPEPISTDELVDTKDHATGFIYDQDECEYGERAYMDGKWRHIYQYAVMVRDRLASQQQKIGKATTDINIIIANPKAFSVSSMALALNKVLKELGQVK